MDVRNFDQEVIEASKYRPVVVDFWAPWCGPCRVLGPVLEKLAMESDGAWSLAKLNTDENPVVASRYGISSIPAVKMFVDGNVVSEFIGALPEQRVRAWLDEGLPSPSRQSLAEAEAALEAGDAEAAKALVTEVLHGEPDNPEAQLLSARLLVFRDPVQAAGLAKQASSAKAALYPKAQAVETLAALVQAAGSPQDLPDGPARDAYAEGLRRLAEAEPDEAAASFVDALRKDKRFHDDASRKALIALFNTLGDRHPVTQKHRRAFEMAVF